MTTFRYPEPDVRAAIDARSSLYVLACASAHGRSPPKLDIDPDAVAQTLSWLSTVPSQESLIEWYFDLELARLAREALATDEPVALWIDALLERLPEVDEREIHRALVPAWLDGEVEADLGDLVRHQPEIGEVYRDEIRARSANIYVPRAGLQPEHLLLELNLPHVDGIARFTCAADGVAVDTPWGRSVAEGDTLRWGDEVTGEVITRVHNSAADLLTATLAELDQRDQMSTEGALKAGHTGVGLLNGQVGRWLAEADDPLALFVWGAAPAEAKSTLAPMISAPDTPEERIAIALELRLLLQELAEDLGDIGLTDALAASDDQLAGCEKATALLDEATWLRLTDGRWLDSQAWWGRRGEADAVFDDALLEKLPTTSSDVDAPHPTWYQNYVAPAAGAMAAALVAERAYEGLAPLPVVAGDGGHLLAIRVNDSGGLWGGTRWVGRDAYGAMHRAYLAVSGSTSNRCPVHPFAGHRVQFAHPRGDDRARELVQDGFDGESCGLPFALALASCWTHRRIPGHIVASGRVGRNGSIGPVGGIRSKAEAIRATLGPDALFLVPPGQDAEARGIVRVRAVATLLDALKLVELPIWDVAGVMNRAEARRRIQERLAVLHSQQLSAAGVAGADPWAVLADEVVALLPCMGDSYRKLQLEARAWASLAYVYARQPDQAWQVRPTEAEIDNVELADVEANALRGLVWMLDLAQLILRDPLDRQACLSLDAKLETLKPSGEALRLLWGRVLGTRGRLRVYLREPQNGLDLLRDALEWHRKVPELRDECTRSGIYLAQGLREAGRLDEAKAVLRTAESELQIMEVASYRHTTSAWLLYEQSRLDLALGNNEVALQHAVQGIEVADGMPHPTLGLQRSRAWALELLGRTDEKLGVLREMEPIKRYGPKVVEEAAGPPLSGTTIN